MLLSNSARLTYALSCLIHNLLKTVIIGEIDSGRFALISEHGRKGCKNKQEEGFSSSVA